MKKNKRLWVKVKENVFKWLDIFTYLFELSGEFDIVNVPNKIIFFCILYQCKIKYVFLPMKYKMKE